ncbi:MAG: two-component regulator propeller domain-containing protein, partial [Anaerolineae bacterium]
MRQRHVPWLRLVLSLGALLSMLLLVAGCGESPPPGSPGTETLPVPTSTSPSRVGTDSAQRSPAEEPFLPSNIKFDHISREDGLSQSSILCIVQDSIGYMWFCTQDGLNRYDGHEFTVYRNDPDDPDSLSQGEAVWLHEDQEGMLWIWKYLGGLDRYDRDTGRFTHYEMFDPPDPESASSDFLWTLYEDPGGTLWAGTYRSGLQRYDREMDRFVQYRHDPDDPESLSSDRVYAVHEDDDGTLWVGTLAGLNRFDRETGRFTRYQHEDADPQTVGADIVQQIHEDQAGRLWVTTFGVGLEQIDRETGEVIARYQHDPDDPESIDENNAIKELYEDRLGHLWLTHFDGRLDEFDPETGTFTRHRHDPGDKNSERGSLSADDVIFVVEDGAGNLWVGTAGGLERYDRETGQFVHYRHDSSDPQSLSSNAVSTFYEDQSAVVWVGTYGNGLNLYDPRRTKFAHYQIEVSEADPESNNEVSAILEDRAGILWLGTSAGLNRFDRETGQFTHYRHDPLDLDSLGRGWVTSIYEDREGKLWIGTRSGLDQLDRATGRFTHYLETDPDNFDLGIGAVYSIVQDPSGDLWLGRHRYGLCRFDPESGECEQHAYNPEDTLNPEDMVRHIYQDGEGILWVGTQGGLLKFDPQTGTSVVYAHDPGDPDSLSHQEVRSIYQDRSGTLWVATDGGGLNRFEPSTETFVRYTDKDGLPSNIVLGILEDAQGNLWLSTGNGLSKFNPDDESFKNYDTGDGLQDSQFLLGAYHQNSEGEMYFGGVNGFNAFHPDDIRDNPYVPPVVLTSLTQGGVDVQPGSSLDHLGEVTFRWPNNFFEFEFAALSYSQSQKNEHAYRLEGFRDESWNDIGTKRFGRYTNLPGGTYTLRLKGSNSDGVWNEEGASLKITVVPPFWESWWFRGLAIAALALLGVVAFSLRTRGIRARSQKLERQVANRTRELATLNAIAVVVSRSLELQQILADALDKILDVTGLEAGGVYLLESDGTDSEGKGVLKVVAHKGLSAEMVEGIDNLVVGEGFSGRVVQTGEPLVVGDLATNPRLTRSVVRTSGFHFVAIVPVVSRASVFGTLFVMSRGQTK